LLGTQTIFFPLLHLGRRNKVIVMKLSRKTYYVAGGNILLKEKLSNLGEDLLKTIVQISVGAFQLKNIQKKLQILG
jgi:hypothetical protein